MILSDPPYVMSECRFSHPHIFRKGSNVRFMSKSDIQCAVNYQLFNDWYFLGTDDFRNGTVQVIPKLYV